MAMEALDHPRVTVATEPCPECHEVCGWCSWYRHQARESGCGCPPYGRKRHKCEKAEALKATTCGTCDGSQMVEVRREILPTPAPRED